MDRLVAEPEKKEPVKEEHEEVVLKKEETKPLSCEIVVKLDPPKPTQSHIQTEYLNSLENMTVADLKKQQEEKEHEEFLKEKETLIEEQFQESEPVKEEEQQVSQNVIEKPNYDFIEEKKVLKLSKKKTEKKKSKKLASLVLACTLGASAIVCVANTVVLENLSSSLTQIEETYNFNLASYLKKIYNLDVTKKNMEMIETYPEELLDAGDLGEKSNWFDRICNFIAGLFGG